MKTIASCLLSVLLLYCVRDCRRPGAPAPTKTVATPVLKRIYTYKGGYRPPFEPDPSRKIEWVDVGDQRSGMVGHGEGGSGGVIQSYEGGRIRFTDGSEVVLRSVTIESDFEGRVATVDGF